MNASRDVDGEDPWVLLTPRENEIAQLVGLGLTNAQIAERLYVSVRTVKTHLEAVFRKLSVSSRTQLAIEVTRRFR